MYLCLSISLRVLEICKFLFSIVIVRNGCSHWWHWHINCFGRKLPVSIGFGNCCCYCLLPLLNWFSHWALSFLAATLLLPLPLLLLLLSLSLSSAVLCCVCSFACALLCCFTYSLLFAASYKWLSTYIHMYSCIYVCLYVFLFIACKTSDSNEFTAQFYCHVYCVLEQQRTIFIWNTYTCTYSYIFVCIHTISDWFIGNVWEFAVCKIKFLRRFLCKRVGALGKQLFGKRLAPLIYAQ